MNNTIIKGLMASCLFLLLVLLAEWQLGKADEQKANISNQGETQEDLNIELPKLTLAKSSIESYSKMVESPLFIQGRKPVITESEVQDEIISKVDDLTLLGIYSIKGQEFALFNKKGKDKKYLKKLEGEDVSGWQIIEIKNDRVIIEQQGNKETLMLRKPKPKVLKRTRPTPSRKKTKLNPEK